MINKFTEGHKDSRVKGIECIIELCVHLLDFPATKLKIAAIETLSKFTEENKDKLADKLLKARFFVNLFMDLKGEVLKQSESLIIFMADKFTKEIIQTMWNCFIRFSDKPEGEVINEMWKVLLPHCDISFITILGEELRKLDMGKYNDQVLDFIEHFAKKLKDPKTTAGKQIFNVKFFWNLIFDDKFPEVHKVSMLDLFISIAEDRIKRDCIDCIKVNFMEGTSIELSMQFLLKINYIDYKESESFLYNYKCIDRCMEACKKFHIKAKDEKSQKRISPNSFLTKARIYLEFLHVVYTTHDKLCISKEKLNQIWDLYYTNPLFVEETDLLWDTISKENKEHIGFFNNRNGEIDFFKCYLENPKMFNVKEMTRRAFECAMKYFNRINNKGDIESYIGIDFLWKIAVSADNYIVRQKAIETLINLYYNSMVATNNEKYSDKVVRGCLKRIFEFKYTSAKEFKHIFTLLTKLISKYI